MLPLVAALALSSGPATPTPTPEIRLAPQKAASSRALAYELMTPESEQVAGNAAPLWIRAGLAARRVNYKWANEDWDEMALPAGKFPVKKFKAILEKHKAALKLAEQAALRKHCDWERPAPTVHTVLEDHFLDDIQTMRELANLLSLRCRVALIEKDFAEAHAAIRIGLTLSRHLNSSDQLIQDLVAIAVSAIFMGRIDEWVQVEGAPNLYWPLTALPRPFIDVRRSIRAEMGTIQRSFPALKEFKTRKLSKGEATAAADKLFEAVAKMMDERPPAWLKGMTTVGMVIAYHDAAKKALLRRGWTEKQLEGMTPVQVVVLNYVDDDDHVRDEVVKLLGLPGHEAYPLLGKVEREVRVRSKAEGNHLTGMLMPALMKVHHAQLRSERMIAALRAAEALREQATRDGKAPARWSDVKAVPRPLDPWTGEAMDAWYSDGVLTMPPPPGSGTNLLGRRYVWPAKR